MKQGKAYTGIDSFRIAAAILIVTIHTSPLSTYSETGDFILTRIVARLAVPFFFMTSGFFLISGFRENGDRLHGFLKKMLGLYLAAILFYLPLNLYNGYFGQEHLLPNLIKDLCLDGTLYHLWYLPAAMLGAFLSWHLVGRLGFGGGFGAALLLYLLGLLGDSYFGLTESLPPLKAGYDSLFEVMDYTRNGLFFAPVFFVMGGFLREREESLTLQKSIVGFVLSFACLFGEGMLLHGLEWQRHDSMYLFLLPCSYFLFGILLHFRGPGKKGLRRTALFLYIIHPMVIVAVRLFAKLLGLQELLIENSLGHFLSVAFLSAAGAAALSRGYGCLADKRRVRANTGRDRAWVEIHRDNLLHNARKLQEAMPDGCRLMAVVKAEGYGHGLFGIATCLNRGGVRDFAVATIDEAIRLRRFGIRGEILILGYTHPARAGELHKFNLTQTLIDYEYARALNRRRVSVKTQLKVDTGMHRLGFDAGDVQKAVRAFSMRYLNICGVFTHLCVSDSGREQDVRFTRGQEERFRGFLEGLTAEGIKLPPVHLQSSYGLLNYPEFSGDYVRAGIALYGALGSPGDCTGLQLDLRPVLS